MSKERKTIHSRLDEDLAEKFNKITSYLGIQNEAETIRYLIQQFYMKNRKEIEEYCQKENALEYFNLDENGVKILDKTNPDRKFVAQIYFKPDGIWCEHCQTDNCKHIQFALTWKNVIKVIKKKKREGWKLPDV